MLPYPLLLALLFPLISFSQNPRVLHYSETSGFDHQTRANSLAMFQSFPMLDVVSDNTGASFDSLSSLLKYDLIVFANTSGSWLLDSTQRSHFERYMEAGGNLMGIHAATDTYRHTTANGPNTGVWDFYAEAIGGSVQTSPNHLAGTPRYAMGHMNIHPSLSGLPSPWSKHEEYYYWERGYLDSSIKVILKVEETIGPNNQVNSYDSARAVSWYKVSDRGSNIFYTSLGHANSSYTSDTLFQKHIWQATQWCMTPHYPSSISSDVIGEHVALVYPNPARDAIMISFGHHAALPTSIQILNAQGRIEKTVEEIDVHGVQVNTSKLFPGLYFVVIIFKDNSKLVKKLVIR